MRCEGGSDASLSSRGSGHRIDGPLLFVKRTVNVGLNSAVEVIGEDGGARIGRVAALDETRW